MYIVILHKEIECANTPDQEYFEVSSSDVQACVQIPYLIMTDMSTTCIKWLFYIKVISSLCLEEYMKE